MITGTPLMVWISSSNRLAALEASRCWAALNAGRLPGHHRDPFDRMLIAQAQIEDLPLVTNEQLFEQYGVTRVW